MGKRVKQVKQTIVQVNHLENGDIEYIMSPGPCEKVIVHPPKLTPEEREYRMNELKKAVAHFMRYVIETREGSNKVVSNDL